MFKLLCSFHGFNENPALPTFLSSCSFALGRLFRREHNTCCEHEREVKKISMRVLYMYNFQQYSKPFLKNQMSDKSQQRYNGLVICQQSKEM